jgi:hypothetical protein
VFIMVTPSSVETVDIFARLAAPFQDHEIEWRVARAGMKGGRPWAQVLAYIDARAARARLNAVLGPANWRVSYAADGPRNGVLATLSLRIDGEWIAKQDGADVTEREPVKGALSGAFKRACAVWLVGEHLYDVGESWAVFSDAGAHRVQIDGATYRWDAPSITSKAPVSRHEPAAKGARPTSRNTRRHDATTAPSALASPTMESAALFLMPFGKHRGMPLRDVPLADLQSARDWAIQKRRDFPGFLEAVALLEGSALVAA